MKILKSWRHYKNLKRIENNYKNSNENIRDFIESEYIYYVRNNTVSKKTLGKCLYYTLTGFMIFYMTGTITGLSIKLISVTVFIKPLLLSTTLSILVFSGFLLTCLFFLKCLLWLIDKNLFNFGFDLYEKVKYNIVYKRYDLYLNCLYKVITSSNQLPDTPYLSNISRFERIKQEFIKECEFLKYL